MNIRSLVLPALALLLLAAPAAAESPVHPTSASTPAAAPAVLTPGAAPAEAPVAAPAPASQASPASPAAPASQASPAAPAATEPPSLPQTATSLAGMARALATQSRGDGSAALTWGQDMAAQDLERLARAAAAFDAAANSKEEVGFDKAQAMVTEMQTAAVRVRNTASISALDPAGQQQALALVAGVQGVSEAFAIARKAAREQVASRSYRPRVSFGIGFGNYWGRPYWGYPGWYGSSWGWRRPISSGGWGWSGGWVPGWRRCR